MVRRVMVLMTLLCVMAGGLPGQPAAASDVQVQVQAPPQPAPPPDRYRQITEGADVQRGGISVYRRGDAYLLELPRGILGRDILWNATLGRIPYVRGNAGLLFSPGQTLGNLVVRFERRGDRVLILDQSSSLETRPSMPGPPQPDRSPAGDPQPGDMRTREVGLPTVLLSIPIVAENLEGGVLIDVTRVLGREIAEFSPAQRLAAIGIRGARNDPERSFVQSVRAYTNNVEVRSLLTYVVGSESVSIEVRYSIAMLPEQAMPARLADRRVGYFTADFLQTDAQNQPGLVERRLITRFRLEKKEPLARVSEPVTPIVFYVTREVPLKWRPYVKQGIEDWQGAFEAAGFKNAILARDAPNDPEWDPGDTRYSTVRWVAQAVENAMGPSTVDPRTGEILSAQVFFWEDAAALFQRLYYLMASPSDPAARRLPLPEPLLGELIRYVVSHEVGHAVGLRHNHKASQAFTIAQLRNPAWANTYGPVASIMSYGRFNYVAQPRDGVTRMIPKISPYDIFAIRYGYASIPSARTPLQERSILNAWLEQARGNPLLAFGGEDQEARYDPTVLTENIGADRIEAARLGMRNLERALDWLPAAVTPDAAGVQAVRETFNEALQLRSIWVHAALKELYGIVETRTLTPRRPQFQRVPLARRKQVLQFLLDQMRTPRWLLKPEILGTLPPGQMPARLADDQRGILNSLTSTAIYAQLRDASLVDGDRYSVVEYLRDVQAGLFEELRAPRVSIDAMRRDLQRAYVARLKAQIKPPDAAEGTRADPPARGRLAPPPAETDLRGAARAALTDLATQLRASAGRAADPETRAHIADLQREASTEPQP